jgi:hypothetical protein
VNKYNQQPAAPEAAPPVSAEQQQEQQELQKAEAQAMEAAAVPKFKIHTGGRPVNGHRNGIVFRDCVGCTDDKAKAKEMFDLGFAVTHGDSGKAVFVK